MTNYKEKYFKYKLKYLKLKGGKIINGGGIKFNGEQWEPTNDLPYSILEAQLFNEKNIKKKPYFKGALKDILKDILKNKNEKDIQLIKNIYEERLKQDTKKFMKHKEREANLGISIDESALQKHSDITNLYKQTYEILEQQKKELKLEVAEAKADAEAEPETKPEAEAEAELELEPAMPPIELPGPVIPVELYELNILISKFDLNIEEYQYIQDLPNIIYYVENIIDGFLDLFMNSKITREYI